MEKRNFEVLIPKYLYEQLVLTAKDWDMSIEAAVEDMIKRGILQWDYQRYDSRIVSLDGRKRRPVGRDMSREEKQRMKSLLLRACDLASLPTK